MIFYDVMDSDDYYYGLHNRTLIIVSESPTLRIAHPFRPGIASQHPSHQ